MNVKTEQERTLKDDRHYFKDNYNLQVIDIFLLFQKQTDVSQSKHKYLHRQVLFKKGIACNQAHTKECECHQSYTYVNTNITFSTLFINRDQTPFQPSKYVVLLPQNLWIDLEYATEYKIIRQLNSKGIRLAFFKRDIQSKGT